MLKLPIIRKAVHDDIETIARLGHRFYDEAEWADVAEWDHGSIVATLTHLLEDEKGILLVCETDRIIGMAGGLVHPLYFNLHHLTGQELFWWVDPEFRGLIGSRLFDAMEAQAKEKGAQSWAMIALARVKPEAVGRFYRRRGYRASEHSYIKALG